ncbi:sensor histidine kinase [Falsirhodobacter sp. 1013]|uniref:sensor histidine kinase n=1 Tax=Falsirhodobacter sp. 1013 TaxID=3417566 RepID=UPI003EBC22D5
MSSLRGRLLAFSALWTAVALALAWLFISALLQDFMEGRFSAELHSVSDAVMARAEWRGALSVTPPGDTRFEEPLSGWYWQVSDGRQVLAKSGSLWTSDLGPDGRLFGPDGAALFRQQRAFTAPGAGTPLTVTVALPQSVMTAEERRILHPLAAALAILGAVLVAASILSVTIGLRALDRMRHGLDAVRAGRAEQLALPRTRELRPLVEDLNHLIAENHSIILRARTHVGNLAHALKTPLAALANAGAEPELVARMDRILRWHLKRARTAAQKRSLGQVTPVRPVLDDLLAVLCRDIGDRGLTLTTTFPDLSFAGEREDLEEMLGNILENAVKWAAGSIRVSGQRQGDGFALTVQDDGPGIAQDHLDTVLARGARLDEGVNGSGLGLSIVSDLVHLYDGRLILSNAPKGGLKATLLLPLA